MIWLYWCVIGLNFLCLLLKRNSKFIVFISFIFLVILMGGNNVNNDYLGYELVYTNGIDEYFQNEYGIRFLFYIGNLIGLSYQYFLIIIFSICHLLNISLVKKLNANQHVYFTLYFLFGFISDTVVMRNFIALTLLSQSLYCLYQQKKVKSIFVLGLSLLFHKTMLFYLPFYFLDFKSVNTKRIVKFGSAIILFMCVLAFFAGSRFEVIGNLISLYVDSGKANAYLMTKTRFGFLIYFFVQIVSTLVVYVSLSTMKRNIDINDYKDSDVSFVEFCFFLNLYVIISFPLLMISTAMHRLFRNIIILNLVALGITINHLRRNGQILSYRNIILAICIFGLVWRMLYIWEIPTEFMRILSNNIMF